MAQFKLWPEDGEKFGGQWEMKKKKQYDIKRHYTLPLRSLRSVNTINTCIQKGCIKMTSIDRKDIYNNIKVV